jgi:hypothetical protein
VLLLESGLCASEAFLPWLVMAFVMSSPLIYFQRAIKAGGDSRFDEIKKQPKKFTYYWMAQGKSIQPKKPMPCLIHLSHSSDLDYSGWIADFSLQRTSCPCPS